jgi:hypothetical protein
MEKAKKINFYYNEINAMVIYEYQKYLQESTSAFKRQLICRINMTSHNLAIEAGI